jgi:TonB family protein
MALLILGVSAALLSWLGISIFGNDRTVSPAVVSHELPPPPKLATEATQSRSVDVESTSIESKPVESELPKPLGATPTPINEVIPNVPQSALNTIRGTVRVSVRVIVDKEGAVVAATADEGSPSRYFERLAMEAAKKWSFAPAESQEQRVVLLRFNFTRAGTTARASSLQ